MVHPEGVNSSVIELDVSEPWEPDATTAGGRRPNAVMPRWLLPALVLLAALSTLAAATPRSSLDPIQAQRIANLSLTFGPDDSFYLSQQRIRGGRLQAYRPGHATARWTVDLPGANVGQVFTGDPSVLIVTVYPANPDSTTDRESVQARDSRTGALRWQYSGLEVLGPAADLILLTDYPTAPREDEPVRAGSIQGVDRRTGAVRWHRTLSPGTLLTTLPAVAGTPARAGGEVTVAELRPDGQLSLIDATGSAQRLVTLPLDGLPLNLSIGGGLVAVSQLSASAALSSPPPTITGYDLRTGSRQWRFEGMQYSNLCFDRYLCDYTADGEVVVIDPRSAAVGYRGQVERFTAHGDRLIVSEPVGPQGTGTAEYDLRTGRRLHSFPGWQLAGEDPDRPVLAARTGAGGRLALGTLDPARGTVNLLGTAGDWLGEADCAWGRHYVGCTGPGGMRIWRLP
jgi:hypothetical protein